MQPPKSWTCEKRFKAFVFWFMYTRSSLKVLKLNFKKYRNSDHDITALLNCLQCRQLIERLSGWMSLQQISISNPSDWGKSDSFDFKLQSNNTKHQNLRKRFTKFFFQRWTIIKYRHIGIFYNHLGEKKTYGVDSHKLCPIFLHKKHITIYCNLIPLPPKESETFDVRR